MMAAGRAIWRQRGRSYSAAGKTARLATPYSRTATLSQSKDMANFQYIRSRPSAFTFTALAFETGVRSPFSLHVPMDQDGIGAKPIKSPDAQLETGPVDDGEAGDARRSGGAWLDAAGHRRRHHGGPPRPDRHRSRCPWQRAL